MESQSRLKKFFKSSLFFIGETLYNIIIVIIIVSLIRSFLISPFHVSGRSMTDTLQHNDYIIINKLSYRFSEPEFGDVIVFTPPTPRMRSADGVQCLIAKVSAFSTSDDACILPDFFIKRVIGLPGDVIEIKDGEVIRNSETLDETYLNSSNNHRTFVGNSEQYKKFTVPEGRYFVLGDNRSGSSDSRAQAKEWTNPETGEVDPYVFLEDIEGKFFFTLLSPQKVQAWFE